MEILVKIRRLLFLLPVFFTLTSCSKDQILDDDGYGGGSGNGDAEVSIIVKVPGSAKPSTRALGEDTHDAEVNEVIVFQFLNGKIKYVTKSTGNPVQNGNEVTFSVNLRTGKYNMMVLANSNDIYERVKTANGGTLVGKDYDFIQSAFAKSIKGKDDNVTDGNYDKWNVTVDGDKKYLIPMWGKKDDVTVKEQTNQIIQTFYLYRMVAKVDVVVERPKDGSDTGGVTEQDFRLTYVSFHNYNRTGLVMPELTKGDWDSSDPLKRKAEKPSLESTEDRVIGHVHCQSWTSMTTANSALEGVIFTFEASKGSAYADRPCVIVGGHHNWDGTGDEPDPSYYRIDMIDSEGNYLDLLRNYKYNVLIRKVKGHGWPTVEEAYKSKPTNIVADVIEWNDSNMGDILFNENNFLSVSPGEFVFPSSAYLETENYDDNLLYIKTDYTTIKSGAKSGWYVESIVDANNLATGISWLKLSPNKGAAKSFYDPADEVKLVLEGNKTNSERAAIITIAAGHFRYKVKVKQTLDEGVSLRVQDVTGKIIQELYFVSKVNVQPNSKTMVVNWTPASTSLNIEVLDGNDAFPSGGNTNVPSNGDIVNDGSGKVMYKITPPAIIDNEVDPAFGGDPMLEKTSIINFKITSGGKTVDKSVLLRQTIYYIFPKVQEKGYQLQNFQDYNIPVLSTSRWEVNDVTDPYGIFADKTAIIGQSGGFNTINGDLLTFRTVASPMDGSLSGRTATIHLIDPSGLCDPVDVEIKVYECGRNGDAVPVKIGARGWDNTAQFGPNAKNTYLVHMYGDRCWMVQNSREGTAFSYGYNNTGSINTDNPKVNEQEGHYYYDLDPDIFATACPNGWHVPTKDEMDDFMSIYSNNQSINQSWYKWWGGPGASIDHGAYAGSQIKSSGGWQSWATGAYWWYGNGIDQLDITANSGGISYTTWSNNYFTIRCVMNEK